MIRRHATNLAAFASPEQRIMLNPHSFQISVTSAAVVTVKVNQPMRQMGYFQASMRSMRSIILLLLGV